MRKLKDSEKKLKASLEVIFDVNTNNNKASVKGGFI